MNEQIQPQEIIEQKKTLLERAIKKLQTTPPPWPEMKVAYFELPFFKEKEEKTKPKEDTLVKFFDESHIPGILFEKYIEIVLSKYAKSLREENFKVNPIIPTHPPGAMEACGEYYFYKDPRTNNLNAMDAETKRDKAEYDLITNSIINGKNFPAIWEAKMKITSHKSSKSSVQNAITPETIKTKTEPIASYFNTPNIDYIIVVPQNLKEKEYYNDFLQSGGKIAVLPVDAKEFIQAAKAFAKSLKGVAGKYQLYKKLTKNSH